ncbi:hypothetical protein [Streptomyces sp. TBY4]|uniref:hypothetical protein n=1 Tax=Streptomyces sp. TBY4 TaxID=2962030 RepID=UPI0020B698D3|nr:hypothetical protein [Streptomyces sp. TBY4]MCP3753507.1 hypothetical protein [Streptomyces sp. TBY4]
MQPVRALRRASALAAGVVAVLLLVCGGLFTHPASAGDAAGMRMDAMAGMPAEAGMPAGAGPSAMAAMPAMDGGRRSGSAGAGSDGGCSDSAQDCPLASAYAPTVQAGPAGDLPGCALGGTRPAAHGRTGPAPPPERSRPRTPDLDSLCVSRT